MEWVLDQTQCLPGPRYSNLSLLFLPPLVYCGEIPMSVSPQIYLGTGKNWRDRGKLTVSHDL